VARERDGGGYCAIQCKFYAPDHHLQKADIDSFFTASGKHPFTSRIVISTTDKWGANAEAALEQQQIPVSRVGLAEIAQAPINWDLAWPSQRVELQLRRHDPKTLRPHQRAAVDDVLGGFAQHDRGKLIMACGTGKTFTSLRIAERVAEQNGGSARVLFLVPSIALLSQTLREWTKGLQVQLWYGDCGIRRVNTLDFIASAQEPRILRSPASVPTPSVEIGFDGWIFPKSGVAFVWVLESELPTQAAGAKR